MISLDCVLSDYVWLSLLELSLLLLFIRALIFDIGTKFRGNGAIAMIKRGEGSWSNIFNFWAIAIIFLEIILASDVIGKYRVLVGLVNALVLIYLILFSVSFKNKIVGWSNKIRDMQQRI